MSTIRTRTLLFLMVMLSTFKPLSAIETNTNIAIDFDSRNVRAGTAGTPTINTNAGFLSWDTSSFGDLGSSSSSSFSSQGVNFELRGLRPSTVPGDDPLPALSFGSRNRGSANGGPFDDLLQDLVFAEGGPDAFVYLKITGLPI